MKFQNDFFKKYRIYNLITDNMNCDDLNKKWKKDAKFLEKVTINFYRNDYAELIKLFILYSKKNPQYKMILNVMNEGVSYNSDTITFLLLSIKRGVVINKSMCEDIYKVIAFHEHDSARKLKKLIEEKYNIDDSVLLRPLYI